MDDEKEREIALYYLRNIVDKPLEVKLNMSHQVDQ